MEEHTHTEETVSVFDTESVESILDEITNVLTVPLETQHSTEGTETSESPDVHPPQENVNTDSSNENLSQSLAIDDMIESFDMSAYENDVTTSRFSGAEWYNEVKLLDITIAGIGGIGSWLSFLIARLKPLNITLFDNDVVNVANLAGQLFSMTDCDKFKVDVMRDKISCYSDYSVCTHNELYNTFTTNVMLCGFDNMSARKKYFDSWKCHVRLQPEYRQSNCLFVDGRLGLEEFQVFAIRGDEDELMKEYEEKFLFDDSEAEQIPCSMKQTSFMASAIASVMTNIVVNFATNLDKPMDVRPMPFLTIYNATTMRMEFK